MYIRTCIPGMLYNFCYRREFWKCIIHRDIARWNSRSYTSVSNFQESLNFSNTQKDSTCWTVIKIEPTLHSKSYDRCMFKRGRCMNKTDTFWIFISSLDRVAIRQLKTGRNKWEFLERIWQMVFSPILRIKNWMYRSLYFQSLINLLLRSIEIIGKTEYQATKFNRVMTI